MNVISPGPQLPENACLPLWPLVSIILLFMCRIRKKKVTSARRVTRCCTKGNPPFDVAPGQRKTHVNSCRRQTVHRGKVDPGVSELPWGNELSREHVNSPLKSGFHIVVAIAKHVCDDANRILKLSTAGNSLKSLWKINVLVIITMI